MVIHEIANNKVLLYFIQYVVHIVGTVDVSLFVLFLKKRYIMIFPFKKPKLFVYYVRYCTTRREGCPLFLTLTITNIKLK